jgi:hypothetical protein
MNMESVDVAAVIADILQAHPKLQALWEATKDQPRGWHILKPDLLALIGDTDKRMVSKVAEQWKRCVQAYRGITPTYSAKLRGYVYPLAGHEVGHGHDRRLARIERQAEKEHRRLAIIRQDELTDHEQRVRAALVANVGRTINDISSQRLNAIHWRKRPETIPQRPRIDEQT